MAFLASLIPAAIGGLTSLFGSSAQSDAASKQSELAKKQWKQARADFAPYREAGGQAIDPVLAAYGLGDNLDARRAALQTGFESSPLYQNVYMPALEQSTNNYNKFASANGQLNSGGTLKALQDRAGTLGGQTFQTYLNGLTGLKDQGQAAAGMTANATAQGQAAQSNAIGAQGDAATAGILGVGNALTNGFNNYNYLNTLSSYGSSPITTPISLTGTGGLY